MPEREPMIETMKASEARQNFSQLLNKVFRRETRVLVERSGIPIAAIISAEDLAKLSQLEAQRTERAQLLARMRSAFADLSEEQIEQDVANVIERVRQDKRSANTSAKSA